MGGEPGTALHESNTDNNEPKQEECCRWSNLVLWVTGRNIERTAAERENSGRVSMQDNGMCGAG